MRVLQFGMSYNHGGVESFVLNYAQRLKAEGIVFDYVDLQGNGLTHSEELIAGGSKIYTLKDSRKHPLYAAREIKRIIKEGGYRCVHINMLSAANLVPVIAALRCKTRVIVHSHNTQTVGIHRKILHKLNRICLRQLPVTRLACGAGAGKWMFGSREFEVVPNAIDTDRYQYNENTRHALREKLGISEETVVLGFVGRLFTQKNPAYLAKILWAVKKKLAKEVKLLIVGDGEMLEDVKSTAAALGVEQDMIYAGRQNNAADWYSAMDAFLLPSLWEGLPLVGVEAQAAGLASFLSDQITDETALTDLVHFCALTENADNWAEEIAEHLNGNAQRCTYAEQIGKTNFSIDNAASLLQKRYCG